MMIELINDHSGISPYKNGIHHVAWIADNFDEENKILQNQTVRKYSMPGLVIRMV